MSDLIRREDAINATWKEPSYTDPINVLTEVRDRINALPSADSGRYIDRAELFNRLAYIKAPPEANEYKAEVYMLIQSM